MPFMLLRDFKGSGVERGAGLRPLRGYGDDGVHIAMQHFYFHGNVSFGRSFGCANARPARVGG
jgi:hypothetical protein